MRRLGVVVPFWWRDRFWGQPSIPIRFRWMKEYLLSVVSGRLRLYPEESRWQMGKQVGCNLARKS